MNPVKNDFWADSYTNVRKPVLGREVVCSSQPLASVAGLSALQQGGNAMDAALATAITLTVVEPVMNGIGGDAFALIATDGRVFGLNASGCAPAAWVPERFAGRDAMPLRGWDAVTVPGQVAGWAALSERFGRLPFADLFSAAIAYADDGFYVSPTIARQWAQQVPDLIAQPGFAETFTVDGKHAPQAGDLWRCPAQADTLRSIAQSRGRSFYEGELARRIVQHARHTGGALTLDDLAHYAVEWVEPLSVTLRDQYTVHELPPNGQGIAALMALGMLNHKPAPKDADDWRTLYHYPIEALKLAFADLHAYVGEPAAMGELTARLLDPAYLAARAASIADVSHDTVTCGDLDRQYGTVYLTAADAEGMVVSYIQSNYEGFGSGVVVPDTGIALHNRGNGFSLKPGHPNQVGPYKRPLHTIIPSLVTCEGKPLISYGVMGGSMQAQGHVQLLQQLLPLGRNPQAGIDAPRFRVQDDGHSVAVEATLDDVIVQQLQRAGHRVDVAAADSLEFGSAQAIQCLDDGAYVAGSDSRRDGVALAR